MPVLARAAAATIAHALKLAPVVVLLGARQTGKTTLVRSLPSLVDRPYLTPDDFDLRARADADPEAVVARAPALVLDEVHGGTMGFGATPLPILRRSCILSAPRRMG
jgi:hypothetical protein